VLVILKKKPPREAAGAERGQKDFKELAAALRRQGRRELARKVEDAARVVAGLAGPRESGTGAGERARPRPADLGRYPAEYADLLARYFGESS